MRKHWLFIALAVILFGCGHSEKESGKTIRRWYYDNGKLKKEQEYINDSIEHGTYRYFYPNGILEDSAQIIHNKFHGKRFLYYGNGILYKQTTYVNNKFRSGITWRSDGTLSYYRAYNYHEELMFLIEYDSLNSPIRHEGESIYSWIQEEFYPIGKEFSVELLIADPPNSRTEVIISDWDIAKQQAENEMIYTPDEFNSVRYSRKQNPEKDMYILHIAKIKDVITQMTITDTMVIKIDKDGKSSYTWELPRPHTDK